VVVQVEVGPAFVVEGHACLWPPTLQVRKPTMRLQYPRGLWNYSRTHAQFYSLSSQVGLQLHNPQQAAELGVCIDPSKLAVALAALLFVELWIADYGALRWSELS
jgi:hypothetical protein